MSSQYRASLSHLLADFSRKIDCKFVDKLKESMKSNQSTDSAPIIGLVAIPDGEKFDSTKKDSYKYGTIGGNNSRVAVQALAKETGNPFYRTRLVSVYQDLTNKQALRLSSQHNMVTSRFNHQITTSDKVLHNRLYHKVVTCNILVSRPLQVQTCRSALAISNMAR